MRTDICSFSESGGGLMNDRIKVFFSITQDEDGFPGIASESVWAQRTPEHGVLRLDNIPFFATAATLGDTIRVRDKEGHLWFEDLARPCGQSLFRVMHNTDNKLLAE
jgi:hypothetical protein